MFELKTPRVGMPEPLFCPQCGQLVGDDGRFCSACGAKVERNRQPAASAPAAEDAAVPTPGGGHRPENRNAEPPTPPPLPVNGSETEPQRGTPDSHCGRLMPEGARFCPFCASPLAPEGPRFSILAKTSGKPDRRFDMVSDDFVIGKAEQCQLRLPNDDFASRQHARIVRASDQVLLEDLGSANGTFLRVRRTMPLEPGDEVLIGTTLLRLERTQG